MKHITLPPQEAPKAVTARRTIPSLGEHALAFMNANNTKSWAEYDPDAPDTLSVYLGSLLNQKEHTRTEAKSICYNLRINLLPQHGMPKQKMGQVYNLMAKLWGYKDWSEATLSSPPEEPIKNLNYTATLTQVSSKVNERKSEPFLDRRISRLAHRTSSRRVMDVLKKVSSPSMAVTLKNIFKEMTALLGGNDIEGEEGTNSVFCVYKDDNDPLKFWIYGELLAANDVPFPERKMYKASFTVYPVSGAIKGTGNIEPCNVDTSILFAKIKPKPLIEE